MADESTLGDPGSPESDGSDSTDTPVDFQAQGEQWAAGAFKNLSASGVTDTGAELLLKFFAGLGQFLGKAGGPIALAVGKAITAAVDDFAPVAGQFAAPIVAGMFGGDVDASAFSDVSDSGGRNAAAQALIGTFIDNLTGGASGPIDADDAGAKRIAAAGLHAAIEGWFLSAVPELIGDCIPMADLHLEPLARLPEDVTRALGIGRMVRSALNPLIRAVATTPMQWKANTDYRPTKLPANVAIKQFLRGVWDDDQLSESLARDGYRDEDMDALVNDAKKFLPTNDLGLLVWLGVMSQDDAVQILSDQGYDQQTASKIIIGDGLRRLEAIHRSVADAAVTAFVEGRIDSSGLDTLLAATLSSDQEKAALTDAADAKRQLRMTDLTPAEAEAAVLAGISPISDYTDALTRAGRSPDAITVLEFLLRKKQDDKLTLDQHKAAQQAARDAAAQAKAAATAAHAAVVQEAAQRKALGSLSTLERAVIHGLIPIDRLTALLDLEFPPDTVAIYVADVQQRAQAYAAAQAKAAAAAKSPAAKRLPIGSLRAAFLDGILSAGDVSTQLAAGGMSADDVNVIIQTWQAALEQKQAAEKLRADAQQRAATKHLSLAEAETLTIAGHWAMSDFNAFLEGLGYNAGDAAHLDQLVQDRITKNAAAAQVKAGAAAANKAKGLSLGQAQRAVVLGEMTTADFQQFLVTEGYTADAISVLMAETQTLIDTANAARARRTTTPTAVDGRPPALAEVTRAARLGLLTPADYQQQLEARGYTPDGVALELQLLSYEIAHAKQPAPAAGSATAAVSGSGDVPIVYANKRHVAVDGVLEGKGISLADAENAVKNGAMTYDAFQQWLVNQGMEASDAELLRALLGIKLGAPGS
jgi:hypothetical protein